MVERCVEKLLFICALVCVMATILIFGCMIVSGFPILRQCNLLSILSTGWIPDKGIYGIGPMIAGTLSIALLAVFFSVPISLGCSLSIYFFSGKKEAWLLNWLIRIMTGIPTVIYGFAGVFLVTPIFREHLRTGSGLCILSAALMLSLLISPTLILFFTESFARVPRSYCNATDALGGTLSQKILYIILPCSFRGMLTGIVLALGRALGDTLIALMMAGNAVAFPDSVFSSARTLTAHIALIIAADFDSIEFRTLFLCGMVLYIFTSMLTLAVRRIGAFEKAGESG